MADFANILNKPVESAVPPPSLPVGTYTLMVQKYEFGESSKKKTPFVRFIYSVVGAGPDVDAGALAGVDLSKKTLRDDFYLTDDALFRLRDHLEKNMGIQGGQRSFTQCLPETQGKTVTASVTQTPSQKPGDNSIFNEITGYVPLTA